MRNWSKSWVTIVCRCGASIGGYNTADPPQLIRIEHKCNPTGSVYVTTELRPNVRARS
jgi:hypothetical protein